MAGVWVIEASQSGGVKTVRVSVIDERDGMLIIEPNGYTSDYKVPLEKLDTVMFGFLPASRVMVCYEMTSDKVEKVVDTCIRDLSAEVLRLERAKNRLLQWKQDILVRL